MLDKAVRALSRQPALRGRVGWDRHTSMGEVTPVAPDRSHITKMASLSAARTGIAAPKPSTRRATPILRAAATEPTISTGPWNPDSWRKLPIVQQPTYPDQKSYKQTLETIKMFPPLVFGEFWRKSSCRRESSLGQRMGDPNHPVIDAGIA